MGDPCMCKLMSPQIANGEAGQGYANNSRNILTCATTNERTRDQLRSLPRQYSYSLSGVSTRT